VTVTTETGWAFITS